MIVRWSLGDLPALLAELGIDHPLLVASERWARLDRQLEIGPAPARDEERPRGADLVEDAAKRLETPADDHASRSRAKATKASASLVGDRPAARTSEISRAGSRPSTRAAPIVPAARSASTAEREMNVTP